MPRGITHHAWRTNDKHKAQWRMTLDVYAAPLRDKPVDRIATEDVLAVLQPIWRSKAETASRLRGRIEKVLDAAKARGLRTGENPALWRGHLDHLLGKRQKLQRGHHPAMPWSEVPAFVERLRAKPSVGALALEFVILTACRSGEVLRSVRDGKLVGARWDEIDREARVWTIPARRMKAGREHRVSLSDRAIAILDAMDKVRRGPFIFPGQRGEQPLSEMALELVMRRMGAKPYTVHGFRSSFRDWAGEATHFPRELAEAALAHTVGDKVERAYRRGDALEKRRGLMEAWAAFCGSCGNSNVLAMHCDAHRAGRGCAMRRPGKDGRKGRRGPASEKRCRRRLTEAEELARFEQALIECNPNRPSWPDCKPDIEMDQIEIGNTKKRATLGFADRLTLARIEVEGPWYELCRSIRGDSQWRARLAARLNEADGMLPTLEALAADIEAVVKTEEGREAVIRLRSAYHDLKPNQSYSDHLEAALKAVAHAPRGLRPTHAGSSAVLVLRETLGDPNTDGDTQVAALDALEALVEGLDASAKGGAVSDQVLRRLHHALSALGWSDNGRRAVIFALDAIIEALPTVGHSAAVRLLRDGLVNLTWGARDKLVEPPRKRGRGSITNEVAEFKGQVAAFAELLLADRAQLKGTAARVWEHARRRAQRLGLKWTGHNPRVYRRLVLGKKSAQQKPFAWETVVSGGLITTDVWGSHERERRAFIGVMMKKRAARKRGLELNAWCATEAERLFSPR